MKRLFVISRLTAHGVRNHDSDNLSEYTELGWELYSTGLHAKEMILRGNITKDDVVMTHPDRMFMYTGLGPTVVPYDENYIKTFDGEVIDYTKKIMQVLDLYNFRTLNDLETNALKYHNAKLSFDLDPNRKFVCIVLRLRDHVKDRGGPVDFWLNEMKKFHESGYDIYCVGKNSELFTPDYVRNVTLEDYVCLISSDLCSLSTGPSSGCMLLNHAFGKANTNIIFFTDDYSLIDRGDGIGHLLIFGLQGNLNQKKTHYYKRNEKI